MSNLPHMPLTAVILAGGRGRRMGMQNKGLMPFRGQALIAHVISRLQPQHAQIVISANDDLDAYRQFGYPVLPDLSADYAGPLAGMHAAMSQQSSEWYLTVPCDTPFLPMDYVARMLAARPGKLAFVVDDGQRQQSTCCLLHHSLLPALSQSLQRKHFAVHRWLQDISAGPVDFSDERDGFININTPEDLQQLTSGPDRQGQPQT